MKRSTLLTMLVMNAVWAGTYPATKALMGHAPFYLVTSFRYLTALLPLLIIAFWRHGPAISPRDLGRAFVIGICSFSLAPALMYQGVTLARASDAAILVSTEPLLTAIGAYFFLREGISRRTAVAMMFAFIGAAVLAEFWHDAGAVRPIGVGLILAALCAESVYSLLGKGMLERVPPLKITAYAVFGGSVVNMAMLSALGMWPAARGLTDGDWVLLFGYLALICVVFGYPLWYHALAQDRVANVAITVFVQPVVGIPLAWLTVGEQPTLPQLAGAAIIVGAVVAAFGGRGAPAGRPLISPD